MTQEVAELLTVRGKDRVLKCFRVTQVLFYTVKAQVGNDVFFFFQRNRKGSISLKVQER